MDLYRKKTQGDRVQRATARTKGKEGPRFSTLEPDRGRSCLDGSSIFGPSVALVYHNTRDASSRWQVNLTFLLLKLKFVRKGGGLGREERGERGEERAREIANTLILFPLLFPIYIFVLYFFVFILLLSHFSYCYYYIYIFCILSFSLIFKYKSKKLLKNPLFIREIKNFPSILLFVIYLLNF